MPGFFSLNKPALPNRHPIVKLTRPDQTVKLTLKSDYYLVEAISDLIYSYFIIVYVSYTATREVFVEAIFV